MKYIETLADTMEIAFSLNTDTEEGKAKFKKIVNDKLTELTQEQLYQQCEYVLDSGCISVANHIVSYLVFTELGRRNKELSSYIASYFSWGRSSTGSATREFISEMYGVIA